MPRPPPAPPAAAEAGLATLKQSLSLWHALLYGMGITIGAGIYVLIGPVAKIAGMAAPAAFVLAAALMSLSALSFAELATRMPVAAGEAAYVAKGFQSRLAGTAIGLIVIAIAITTSATISLGSAEYIRVFLDWPEPLIVTLVVLAMGGIAAWGIVESITFAGLMTVIETGGLVLIASLGFLTAPGAVARLPEVFDNLTHAATLQSMMAAGLLAVFAFIGFEGIVNIAEEMKNPVRDLPRAILLTLAITALVYFAVVWISLVTLGQDTLGRTEAPLAAVFVHLTGWPPATMAAIAIVATLNGIIASIILAARVAYGMAKRGHISGVLGRVNPITRTPLLATVITTILVLVMALAVPLTGLAELSSRLTLIMFAAINASLVAIKARETAPPPHVFVTSRWVPVAGLVATAAFLVGDLLVV